MALAGGIHAPLGTCSSFISVFTALNNTKKQRKLNITPYGEKVY